MSKLSLLLLAASLLISPAKALLIEDFRSDLYSKSGAILPIIMSLQINAQDADKAKILDSINTVISGYFYEDIFTETGKESLKATIIKYASKRHLQNIDEVLILKLHSLSSQQLIKRLNELIKELPKNPSLFPDSVAK